MRGHRVVDSVEQKYCSKCQQWLPLDSFHKNCSTRDGLYYYCRTCSSIANGRRSTGTRHYRHQLVDGVEQKRCSNCGRWLPLDHFHKDCFHKSASRLQSWCKACTNSRNQEWSQDNPEQVAAMRARRRARVRGALGEYTGAEFEALCEATGNHCLCCGRELPLGPDHVVPLSRGGSNDISNIQPLCKSCNSSKGTKAIDYRVGFEAT